MSWQETHTGIFRKLDMSVMSLEGHFKNLCNTYFDVEVVKEERRVTWQETWERLTFNSGLHYGRFFVHNEELYEVVEDNDLDNEDFVNVQKLDEENYSFVTSFYNGGASLNDMLKEGLNGLGK